MNRVFKNSLFNILRSVVLIPVYLFVTPYTLNKLGVEQYGIWALIGVISSYQIFVELGFTNAIIRYVALCRVKDDTKGINEYLAVGLLSFTVVPAVLIIIVWFLRSSIVTGLLGIERDIQLAEELLMFSVFSIMLNLLATLFKSVLDGYQRMDVSNMLVVMQSLLMAGLNVLFLELGYGLAGMTYSLTIASTAGLVINAVSTVWLYPEVRINLFLFRFDRLREIFSYSINLQISSVFKGMITPLYQVIISHFFDLKLVAYFDLAQKFIIISNSLITSGLISLFPAATEKYDREGADGIERLRKKSLQFIYPLTTLVYFSIFIFIPNFTDLWLGEEYRIVSNVIRFLLVANYFISLAVPAYNILNGTGYSKDTLGVQLKSGMLELVGMLLGGWLFGFWGLCSSFSVSIICGFFLTHSYYRRRFLLSESAYAPFLSRNMLIFLLVLTLLGVVAVWIPDVVGRFTFIPVSGIYFLLGLFIIVRLRLLTVADFRSLVGR